MCMMLDVFFSANTPGPEPFLFSLSLNTLLLKIWCGLVRLDMGTIRRKIDFSEIIRRSPFLKAIVGVVYPGIVSSRNGH